MAAAPIIEVPSVLEVNPAFIALTGKKVQEVTFGEGAERQTNRIVYTEAYYNGNTRKLCFTVPDVRTYRGIELSTKSSRPSGYIRLSLSPEQAKMIREKVDDPLFENLFANRASLIKDGKDIKDPLEIRRMFKGLVQTGDEKADTPGTYWPDSMILNVAMRRSGAQIVVDDASCSVTDIGGVDYGWSNIGNKVLDEVCIQVDRIRLEDTKFAVKGVCKFLTIKEKAEPKFTSKRRLEQGSVAHVSAAPIRPAPVSAAPGARAADITMAPVAPAVGTGVVAAAAQEMAASGTKRQRAV
jgi:hypothetical protein